MEKIKCYLNVEFGFHPHNTYLGSRSDFRDSIEAKLKRAFKKNKLNAKVIGAGYDFYSSRVDIGVEFRPHHTDKVVSVAKRILRKNRMAKSVVFEISFAEDIFGV